MGRRRMVVEVTVGDPWFQVFRCYGHGTGQGRIMWPEPEVIAFQLPKSVGTAGFEPATP